MKSFARGLAVLAVAFGAIVATTAQAQDKTALETDRDKVSYMVGMDVARSLQPIAGELDTAALQRALQNAFSGGKPLLSEDEAKQTDADLRAVLTARAGQTGPGAAPGAAPPAVDKSKVGLMVGGYMVGPSLAPIADEIDLPVLMQGLRTALAGGKPLLDDAEAGAVRDAFSKRMQDRMQAKASELAGKNRSEGEALLASNKQQKGVFTTGSGLQYMVLRQGSGPRPKATDRVRVNYQGTLVDGTVFDSSYQRGEPAEFQLNQVIPGWTEGVSMMPVGSKYRFWIPADLAYGEKGTPGGPIGPDATLVFDVELMGILQ